MKNQSSAQNVSEDKSQKKKGKFQKVQIEDLDQGKILLPGRSKCDCMATKHKLINNCLACGKIVCEQEGEGPCYFCGNPVYLYGNPLSHQDFMTIGDTMAKEDSAKLRALEHKNKLLGYERNKIPGSNIVDDETDWYEISENVWLTEKQRDFAVAKIKEEDAKKEEDQQGIKLAFDLTRGKFVEGESTYDEDKAIKEAQSFLGEISKNKQRKTDGKSANMSSEQEEVYQNLSEKIRAAYKEQAKKALTTTKGSTLEVKSKRVQHEDIFEDFKEALQKKTVGENAQGENLFDEEIFPIESETGSCLSMHQPWASLVVYGFKRFEGRMWTSRFRGPLWIQAGSKVPTEEEIKMVEDQYKELYKNVKDLPPFPERYPTGCLLGIIDLEDIVRVEDYFKYIPEDNREETGCKYLFVCRNPRKLLYPIKLSGERQIFRIDNSDMLQSAKRNLMKVKTNWYPYYANLLRGKERTFDEELELENMMLEYRPEDVGLFVGKFLSSKDMSNLAEDLIKLLKQDGTKYVGRSFIKTTNLENLGSIGEKIKQYVPLIAQKRLKADRSSYEDKMDVLDFFLLGEKEKLIQIDKKYSLLILLGRSVKFSYELYKKKAITLANGWMILLNEAGKTSLTIENVVEKIDKDNEDVRNILQITENNALLGFL